jgi:group I intron endonuclease
MSRPLYDISSASMCSIYVIKNSVNDKIYVGQTWRSIERRFQVHVQNSTANHCVKLRRAIKKYGVENFRIELLTFCHTQEMANYWETYFIHKFKAIKYGYNVLESGFSRKGIKHTPQTKRKMSISNSGGSNGNSSLELWQVSLIRDEYKNFKNPKTGSKYGIITFLAKKYNVGITTIFEIVKGLAWL